MKRRSKHRPLNTKYEQELDEFLDVVFAVSDRQQTSNADLARTSGLAQSTVSNIERRITRLPQLQTVWLLAQAVGLELWPSLKRKARLRVFA